MKILFCETFDDGTVGGSHACMYNLIKNMDRSKFDFTVGFYSENIYVQKYKDLGVEVKILPMGPLVQKGNRILRKLHNWYNMKYQFIKYLKDYLKCQKFNLVILNNSIFVSLPYVSVCKKLRIPVIVYERGIDYFEEKHIKATENVYASIPISNAVLHYLQNYNFRTPIIERIYDGIDPSTIKVGRSPDDIKSDIDIPAKGKVVGIVGNIRPWKGQKYFVDAFLLLAKEYDDIYGLIVGGWAKEDDQFQVSLRKTIENAGLEKRLLFLGYRKDVHELLSIFDVFVHASTKPEPFGMVILEAMAMRKPVIATNMGGPIEILNNGECGILVPPKDGKVIAEACVRYFSDPLFSQRMIDKAYERLIKNFHINQTVEKTVKLFERGLSSN